MDLERECEKIEKEIDKRRFPFSQDFETALNDFIIACQEDGLAERLIFATQFGKRLLNPIILIEYDPLSEYNTLKKLGVPPSVTEAFYRLSGILEDETRR